VEWKLSATALSRADPVRPIDWVTSACVQANSCPGVLTALVGVEYHPGDLAAADRDRHTQRAPCQLGVVMGVHAEPDDPPGMQVQHTG
jgi:hypothetical protein